MSELIAKANSTERDAWTTASTISEAYPVYRPGSDRIAYYECKVTTDAEDSGSILINVDESDILIPEATPRGKTTTEQYAEQLGDWDFRVVRYDWVRTAAVGLDGTVRAKRGFVDETTASDEMAAMERANAERGVFPLYDQKTLQTYYKELRKPQENTQSGSDFVVAQQAASWRSDYVELKHAVNGAHTPTWQQYYDTTFDRYIGCGPLAWTIVYAYWRQFKNAKQLFEGLEPARYWGYNPPSKREFARVLSELHIMLNTYTEVVDGKNQGYTKTDEMCDGVSYGYGCGYPYSCSSDTGTEVSKFSKVNSSLSDDRPVIIFMGTKDENLLPNHFGVIEAAEKSQMKYALIWHDRSVRYLINFGNGNPAKWIYTWDWGPDNQAVYASWNMFHFNMTVPTPVPPLHWGTVFQGHEYQLYSTLRTWDEAWLYCWDRGGHLVTIGSADENAFVANMLNQTSLTRIWLGLADWYMNSHVREPFVPAQGRMGWVTQEPLTYTNWFPNEPNGDGPEAGVEMRSSGQWNDLPYQWTAGYVCEWDS